MHRPPRKKSPGVYVVSGELRSGGLLAAADHAALGRVALGCGALHAPARRRASLGGAPLDLAVLGRRALDGAALGFRVFLGSLAELLRGVIDRLEGPSNRLVQVRVLRVVARHIVCELLPASLLVFLSVAKLPFFSPTFYSLVLLLPFL